MLFIKNIDKIKRITENQKNILGCKIVTYFQFLIFRNLKSSVISVAYFIQMKIVQKWGIVTQVIM